MTSRCLLICDERNPHSLRPGFKFCAGIIGAILLSTFIVLIILPLFGLGLSYGIYDGQYDMTTGKSFYSNLSYGNIRCYNNITNIDINSTGMCMIYGIIGIVVLVGFGFVYTIPLGIYHSMLSWWWLDCKDKNINNNRYMKFFLIGAILLLIFMYFLTVALGLLVVYIGFGKTYNLTTGWSLVNSYDEQLICFANPNGSFLISCMMPGMFGWIMIIMCILVLGVLALCLWGICKWFKMIYDSCVFASKFNSNENDINIKINEEIISLDD